MVLLCGGLVGPIFLVVYFALGQMSIMKSMFWVGLLVTAADVLIALGLANFGAKFDAKTQMLEASGVLALAQITGIAETGTRINDQPLVKINLHVQGPGLTPFDTQDSVIASVTRLPMITGRKLVLLVGRAVGDRRLCAPPALGDVDPEVGEREQPGTRVEHELGEVGRPVAAHGRERLAHLERVADRGAERLVHVGEQADDLAPGAAPRARASPPRARARPRASS